MIGGDRLRVGHIQAGGGDSPIGQSPGQGGAVHHRAPGSVHQSGGGFHQGQGLPVEQMPGFGGQADQHRYMVRLPQQRLQRAELRPQAGLRLRVAGAAIVKNPHSEPGRPPGHRLADAPQPDDPQGGIVQVVAQHSLRIPVAPLPRRHLPHPLFETAGGGDQQTEGDVGGGFGQHVRGVAHRNPELGAGGQINVVHPHRHLADRPQTGGGLQDLPVDAVGEHCQHSLRLRNPLQQNLPGNGILQRPYPHRPRRAQRLLHHRKGATGYHYPRH